MECAGGTVGGALWRESDISHGTCHRSGGARGTRAGVELHRRDRCASTVAVGISFHLRVRDGRGRAHLPGLDPRSVHGDTGRHLRARFGDRRAIGRSDRPSVRVAQRNSGLRGSGVGGCPDFRHFLPQRCGRACGASGPPCRNFRQRVQKACGLGARGAVGPGWNGEPERKFLRAFGGSGLVPSGPGGRVADHQQRIHARDYCEFVIRISDGSLPPLESNGGLSRARHGGWHCDDLGRSGDFPRRSRIGSGSGTCWNSAVLHARGRRATGP